jgi:hypothetical protein
MSINVSEDGSFELIIDSSQLSRGLRPSKRTPRNSGFLTESKGIVGFDGVLQAIEQLTRLDTSAINTAFPFPQIFVFTRCIIVCNQTVIYEWDGDSLVEKISSGLTAGSTWSAVDLFDYVYLSNGKQVVVRDPSSKVYAVTTALPTAVAACNFNGQIILGGANCSSDITALVESVKDLGVAVTIEGDGLVGNVLGETLSLNIAIRGEVE